MSECQEFGPLISAMIDDELSPAELASVNSHLGECEGCRAMADSFHQIDRLDLHPVQEACATKPASQWRGEIEDRVHRRRRRQKLSWAGTLAVAALFMVAMVGFLQEFRSDDQPSVNKSTTNEFTVNRSSENKSTATAIASDATSESLQELLAPFETLQIVSQQEDRTYDSMRRLMELDLRALRLELQHMDLEPEQLESLTRRIDMLIERVSNENTKPQETGASI